MRRAVLTSLALAVLSGPALAAGIDRCSEPFGPALPTAASTTIAQLPAIKKEVEAFIRDSDAFQSCLVAVMDVKDEDEKLSKAEMAQAQRKLDSNQREKEAIGAAYNALAKQVKANGR